MATLTRAQRSWLTELGDLVGDTVEIAEDEDPEDDGGAVVKGSRPGSRRGLAALADDPVASDEAPDGVDQKKQLFGLGPEDLVGPVIAKLAGPLSATGIIQNNTQQTLRIDFASFDEHEDGSGKTMGISSGEYEDSPPEVIQPGEQNARFKGVNVELALGIRLKGVEGFIRYFLDEQKTAWVLHFNNPRAGDNTSTKNRLEGPNAAKFEIPKVAIGGGNNAKFLYVLKAKGGATPPTPVPPTPTPQAVDAIASSCLIQIENKTTQKLNLKAAKHERGDFMVRPKVSIDPEGVDDAIVSIETPRAPDEGCKGFIEYTIGEPPIATWRVEWDNPEGQKNTADAPISPASPTLDAVALISQGDENVRVNFLLRETGGGAPTPVPPNPLPVPPTPVPPKPVVPKSRQPTLRQGDKSADGWVEYLQQRLNELINAGLKVDGDFGRGTLAAVHKFQQTRGLQDDGTVGNQTWAALRDATPEDPSTDGRKPHTFVEKGPEARWNDEKQRAVYLTKLDEMLLFLVSVGTQPIDDFSVDVTVTAPGMPAASRSFPIGKPDKVTGTGSGSFHSLKMNQFRKLFPSKDPKAKITDYVIVATLPKELSGEGWTGDIVEG